MVNGKNASSYTYELSIVQHAQPQIGHDKRKRFKQRKKKYR